MTQTAAQRYLIAIQAQTDPATLKDLIACWALNQKTDDESVGQFLKGCLTYRAALHSDGPFADLAPIDDASHSPGWDARALIFDEMEEALITDERFRNHFFRDDWKAFITSGTADAPAEVPWNSAGVPKALVEAALAGRLILFDGGGTAAILPADHTDARNPSS